MYKKIVPEVLTSSILDLIDNEYLGVETRDNEYYLYEKGGNIEKLKQSDKYLLNILNRIIDGKKNVSLTKLYNFCKIL